MSVFRVLGQGGGAWRVLTDLVVKLSLACMFDFFSSAVQLLILSPDLVVARLVVFGQAGVLCLHPPHFGFQTRHLSRKLVVLQALSCVDCQGGGGGEGGGGGGQESTGAGDGEGTDAKGGG